jgi:hypothetical protein
MITATLVALTGAASAYGDTPRDLRGQWCVEDTETGIAVGTRGHCHRHKEGEETEKSTMTITAESIEFGGQTCKEVKTTSYEGWRYIKTFCVETGQLLEAGPTTEQQLWGVRIFKGKLQIKEGAR